MSLTGGAKHRRRRSPRKSPKKGKVGSKKNPYPSKAKASRSQKKELNSTKKREEPTALNTVALPAALLRKDAIK